MTLEHADVQPFLECIRPAHTIPFIILKDIHVDGAVDVHPEIARACSNFIHGEYPVGRVSFGENFDL